MGSLQQSSKKKEGKIVIPKRGIMQMVQQCLYQA